MLYIAAKYVIVPSRYYADRMDPAFIRPGIAAFSRDCLPLLSRKKFKPGGLGACLGTIAAAAEKRI